MNRLSESVIVINRFLKPFKFFNWLTEIRFKFGHAQPVDQASYGLWTPISVFGGKKISVFLVLRSLIVFELLKIILSLYDA
jgi:hypothetical protein